MNTEPETKTTNTEPETKTTNTEPETKTMNTETTPNDPATSVTEYLPFDIRAEFCKPPADDKQYESFDQEIKATFRSDEETLRFLRDLRGSLDEGTAKLRQAFDDEIEMVLRMRGAKHFNAPKAYRRLAMRLAHVATSLRKF